MIEYYNSECTQCCGTCKWCRKADGAWICFNSQGDYYGLDTAYDDVCDEHEGR